MTLLKNILLGVLPAITKVINLSLQSGLFPRKWKNAVVTLLLKKQGMDLLMSSYRSVSNLPYLSKLVEKQCLHKLTPTAIPRPSYTATNWLTGKKGATEQCHSA